MGKKVNHYVVYVHICPNEKRYYGYTSLKPERRWGKDGCGYKKRNSEFYNDIIYYGWDNIEHIIIADNLSKEEAELLEEQLILENKSYDSEFGHNKYIGKKWTDEQRETRKEKGVSKETRKKISEANKGKVRSKKTRKKLSKARKGKDSPNHKSVICITTMMVFNSITEGANYYNINRGNISQCCRGKYKSAGKFNDQKLIWRYLTIIPL